MRRGFMYLVRRVWSYGLMDKALNELIAGLISSNIIDIEEVIDREERWHRQAFDEENEDKKEKIHEIPCELNRFVESIDLHFLPTFTVHGLKKIAHDLINLGNKSIKEKEALDLFEPGYNKKYMGLVNDNRCGMELLGFYLPFHYYADNWGIYLFSSRIGAFAKELSGKNSIPYEAMLGAIVFNVLKHEWHHFMEEVMLSHIELVSRMSYYLDWSRFYTQNRPNNVINEALANARALKQTRYFLPKKLIKRKKIIDSLIDMMKGSMGSYREFDQYLKNSEYREGLSKWLNVATNRPDAQNLVIIAEAARLRHKNARAVPVRIIDANHTP